ncbi:MAG: aspartate carbamoyltransferase regulatory subunit [Euryarchaeota archaeon]|nr:aspartate carbamoyltransferase regulatory subunit [Euryarchaeota archaeon]
MKGAGNKKELRVLPIRKGTVIDHIPGGRALRVLRILGITDASRETVSVAMNVPSRQMGRKDIVKVENRELVPGEVQKIALIAPRATINIIDDMEVRRKMKVSLPREIEGVLRCSNPNCISNTPEPAVARFRVENGGLRCFYCERMFSGELTDHI